MLSTNFSQHDIKKINDSLSFAIDNHYSSFYRTKLGLNSWSKIVSYEEFQKLPFLSKDDILASTIEEKTFVEPEKITRYKISGGTSNKNGFTLIPSDSPGHSASFPRDTSIKRFLVLMPPMSNSFFRHIICAPPGVIAIPGDVRNLPLSAMVSVKAKIEAIISSPTILNEFAKELGKINFDFRLIKFISLGSEYCSSLKLAYFKNIFTNAKFSFRFASTETDRKGMRCEYLDETAPPNHFHPVPNSLVEIIDTNGEIVEIGTEGEMVHTDTRLGKPFPLIRYRTGDIAKLEHRECLCGNNYTFIVEGKNGLDYFKFYGVLLKSSSIENALTKLSDFTENKFQVHVHESASLGTIKPKLILNLELNSKSKSSKNDPEFLQMLNQKFSENLLLSGLTTLSDLVNRGVFLPLEIKILDDFPFDHHKSRNIISHLN